MQLATLNLFFLIFFVFVGCSSKNKIVEKIPVTEIQKPYTLPDGAKSWSTVAVPVFSSIVINPLYWEQSLSDNWSLIWAPMPLGFKYQAFNTETNRLGVSFYSIILSTIGSIDYRQKLNSDWAIDLGYILNQSDLSFIGVKATNHFIYMAPIYQFTEKFSGQLGLAYLSGSSTVGGGVIGAIFNSTTTSTVNFSGLQKLLGLQYSFNNQWSVKAGINSTQLNGYNEYSGYSFAFTHYWD